MIDPKQLAAFAESLRAFTGSGHVVAELLGGPVLAITLVLLRGAGADVDTALTAPTDLEALAQRMPV